MSTSHKDRFSNNVSVYVAPEHKDDLVFTRHKSTTILTTVMVSTAVSETFMRRRSCR